MMPRIIGNFRLSGQFDPDDITQQLGIEPSWVNRIGDPGPPDAIGPRLGAEWGLVCGEDDYGDLTDQVSSLLSALEYSVEAVSDLSSKFAGTFYVVAYLDGNYPGFFLNPSMIQKLAALNVTIQCEYVYAPNGPIEETRDAD